MNNLQITTTKEVNLVFDNYPNTVQHRLIALRELIFETAREIDEINTIQETLKWGEPSYLTTHGSTIRIDYKSKTPRQYAMYFKCTSRLVEVFKTFFNNQFNFEGNRAITFKLEDEIPTKELKQCIKAALIYHKVKHLPTLGL